MGARDGESSFQAHGSLGICDVAMAEALFRNIGDRVCLHFRDGGGVVEGDLENVFPDGSFLFHPKEGVEAWAHVADVVWFQDVHDTPQE